MSEILNSVVNHNNDVSVQNQIQTSSYLNITETKSISNFESGSSTIISSYNSKLTSLSKKNMVDSDSVRESLMSNTYTELSNLKNDTISSYTSNTNNYTNSIISGISTDLNEYTQSTISDNFNFISNNDITELQTTTINSIDEISTSIVNLGMDSIDNVTSKITSLFESKVGVINSIKSFVSNPVSILDNITSITNNFYKRDTGTSSTSKYIQTKLTNVDGTLKDNISVLSDTPSSKILVPQLKFDMNTTISFMKNPLAGILGFVCSLIPNIKTKPIKEPTPTDNLAEYGKIIVRENKAGFVEINDETPGNVRQINVHPTGTYTSLLDNGDYNVKVTNDKQEIIDGDWKIKTSGDKIEIVSGDNRIEIRKDKVSNISGNSDTNVAGDQNNQVTGDVTNDFKSNYSGKISLNYNESVGGSRTEKTGESHTEQIGGFKKETIGGSLTIQVAGSINIVCGSTTNIMTSGVTNITSGALINIKAPMIKLG